MGQEISDFDIQCLKDLCDRTIKMFEFRREIQEYLKGRMEIDELLWGFAWEGGGDDFEGNRWGFEGVEGLEL